MSLVEGLGMKTTATGWGRFGPDTGSVAPSTQGVSLTSEQLTLIAHLRVNTCQ